jgi:uncharacterized membrane protein YdbT with pleckstrin-like domain
MKTVDADETKFVVKPSQWINIFWLSLALGSFVTESIPLVLTAMAIWLWKSAVTECWQYRFGDMTITEKKGVFSHEIVEVHYYRIKSIKVERPFLYRIAGLSRILIITSEPFKPKLILIAIEDGNRYKNFIKEQVSLWRKKLGVKETDFHAF